MYSISWGTNLNKTKRGIGQETTSKTESRFSNEQQGEKKTRAIRRVQYLNSEMRLPRAAPQRRRARWRESSLSANHTEQRSPRLQRRSKTAEKLSLALQRS